MMKEKYTILHADDEKSIRIVVKAGLERSIPGLNVESFDSGKSIIERLKRDMSGVRGIITDYNMLAINGPSINGVEVIKESVSRYPNIPVIFLCSQNENIVQRALDAGAHGYLKKPLMIKELSEYVKKAINL